MREKIIFSKETKQKVIELMQKIESTDPSIKKEGLTAGIWAKKIIELSLIELLKDDKICNDYYLRIILNQLAQEERINRASKKTDIVVFKTGD